MLPAEGTPLIIIIIVILYIVILNIRMLLVILNIVILNLMMIIVIVKGSKRERTECKNYRGVRLLSVVGKIFAGVLVDRVRRVTGV